METPPKTESTAGAEIHSQRPVCSREDMELSESLAVLTPFRTFSSSSVERFYPEVSSGLGTQLSSFAVSQLHEEDLQETVHKRIVSWLETQNQKYCHERQDTRGERPNGRSGSRGEEVSSRFRLSSSSQGRKEGKNHQECGTTSTGEVKFNTQLSVRKEEDKRPRPAVNGFLADKNNSGLEKNSIRSDYSTNACPRYRDHLNRLPTWDTSQEQNLGRGKGKFKTKRIKYRTRDRQAQADHGTVSPTTVRFAPSSVTRKTSSIQAGESNEEHKTLSTETSSTEEQGTPVAELALPPKTEAWEEGTSNNFPPLSEAASATQKLPTQITKCKPVSTLDGSDQLNAESGATSSVSEEEKKERKEKARRHLRASLPIVSIGKPRLRSGMRVVHQRTPSQIMGEEKSANRLSRSVSHVFHAYQQGSSVQHGSDATCGSHH